MKFSEIKWPIYYISEFESMYTELNVTYVVSSGTTHILDNKNLASNTLGGRRLKIIDENIYIFKKTLYILSELVDFTRNKNNNVRYFIDSRGMIFNYKKTIYCKLVCLPIKSVDFTTDNVYIKVFGITQTFELPKNYYKDMFKYVQALKYDGYYILYDLLVNKVKNTSRKI